MEEVPKINYLNRDKGGNDYYRRKVPVTASTLNGWRSGKIAPTSDELTAFADALNLSLHERLEIFRMPHTATQR